MKTQHKEYQLKIIAALIMLCGMTGSLAIANAVFEGYYFFLAGSTLGVYWCYHKDTYTLMALDVFYTVANVIGIYNHIIMGG